MEEHKQDARQDAIDMAHYVTDADKIDATKFVDLMIAACTNMVAARVGELDARLDRTNAAIGMLEMGENTTTARIDALQLESDRRWAAREDVVASRLDKLDACAVHDASLIQTLHERTRKLETEATGLETADKAIRHRLANLELHARGMDDTMQSHSRQINALRAMPYGGQPGKGWDAKRIGQHERQINGTAINPVASQADVWEDSPIGPDRSPERLMGIIADLNLHLTDIMGVLDRSNHATESLKHRCGPESYMHWKRLASKACDNARAVL